MLCAGLRQPAPVPPVLKPQSTRTAQCLLTYLTVLSSYSGDSLSSSYRVTSCASANFCSQTESTTHRGAWVTSVTKDSRACCAHGARLATFLATESQQYSRLKFSTY